MIRAAFSVFLLAAASVLAATGHAADPSDPKPLVITVERTTGDGSVESWQVAFDSRRARIVSNSNFLDVPGPRGRIGVLSAAMNPRLRTEWLAMSQIRQRREREAKVSAGMGLSVPGKPSAHALRWSIGTDAIPSGSPYIASIRELIERLPSEAEWKAESAASVEWEARSAQAQATFEGEPSRKAERLRCRSEGRVRFAAGSGEKLACRVEGFGTIYLLR